MIVDGKVDCMETLMGYVEEGLIRTQRHETLPLTLYNYTEKCTFGRQWDSYTKACRGLILHDDGMVIARPFDKFFNMSELPASEARAYSNMPFECYDKLDGSLGIIWNYMGRWYVSTRGSFVSVQAVKAQEMLATQYRNHELNPLYTYMTEIIYPENRVVLDYGTEEKLVFLGARHTWSGEPRTPMREVFPMAKSFPGMTWDDLTLAQRTNSWSSGEGWVLVFEDGNRVKMKTDDYLRVHRLRFAAGPKHVWEQMLEGTFEESIKALPEEFREESETYYQQFTAMYDQMTRDITSYNYTCLAPMDSDNYRDKAIRIKTEAPTWAQPALLQLMRGNHPRDYIMKLLKPHNNEMPNMENYIWK